jgi:D-alanyl-D-alanine carboxypeptidase
VLIEHITGQPLAQALQQRLFEPAAMRYSGLYSEQAIVPKLARGYTRLPTGELVHPPAIHASVSFAAAGLYTSVDDLFRFYGTRLLQPATRALMLQAHSADYGFGWTVGQWKLPDGRRLPVVSHTGSVPGYQSYYLRSEQN